MIEYQISFIHYDILSECWNSDSDSQDDDDEQQRMKGTQCKFCDEMCFYVLICAHIVSFQAQQTSNR